MRVDVAEESNRVKIPCKHAMPLVELIDGQGINRNLIDISSIFALTFALTDGR